MFEGKPCQLKDKLKSYFLVQVVELRVSNNGIFTDLPTCKHLKKFQPEFVHYHVIWTKSYGLKK